MNFRLIVILALFIYLPSIKSADVSHEFIWFDAPLQRIYSGRQKKMDSNNLYFVDFWHREHWRRLMSMVFFDPSVAPRKTIALAPRPASLKGKVVGLFDNTKEQADIVLATLGEQLVKHHGVKELVTRHGIHYSKPAPLETVEEMARKCDVVICALGG